MPQTRFFSTQQRSPVDTMRTYLHWLKSPSTDAEFPSNLQGILNIVPVLPMTIEQLEDDSTDKLEQLLQLILSQENSRDLLIHSQNFTQISQRKSLDKPLKNVIKKGHLEQFNLLIRYGCLEGFPNKDECTQYLETNPNNVPAKLLLAYHNANSNDRFDIELFTLSDTKQDIIASISNGDLKAFYQILAAYNTAEVQASRHQTHSSLSPIPE